MCDLQLELRVSAMATTSPNLLTFSPHSSPRQRESRRGSIACLPRGFPTLSSTKSYMTHADQLMHLESNVHTSRIEELKQRVRKQICSGSNLASILTSIDTIQRLGIGYHFKEDISMLLDRIYDVKGGKEDLFSTALRFRLLRQEGYNVTTDIFHEFVDTKGRFKESLNNDLSSLLSLFEASHLGAEGEEVLSQAMVFSKQHLETSMLLMNPDKASDIALALASPRQWRTTRLGAKNFIEEYGKEFGRNSDALELATLDFNIVQSLNHQEIAELKNWWKELDLTSSLSFARDRPLECYLWTLGIFPDPCYSRCRIEVAKAVAILLVLDDVYDSYASLEELLVFTDAIRRWDIDAIEELPEYMKICYMAIYNTTNDIGYKILKKHGHYVVPHLAKTWIDICEAFLIEAKWFNSGVVPNLEKYVRNGITSAGTYMALVHAFYLMGDQINTKASTIVNNGPKLFTSAGRILRLWDDLGTARDEQERGDVASTIECYMKENGSSSEDDARSHVRCLIHKAWQGLNEESIGGSQLPRSIIKASLNVARTAQSIYQHGDDDRFPSVNDHIHSLLEKPIIIRTSSVQGR